MVQRAAVLLCDSTACCCVIVQRAAVCCCVLEHLALPVLPVLQLQLRAPQSSALQGVRGAQASVRSQCRFINRGTEYVRGSGMKWTGGGAKRRCDRAPAQARFSGVGQRGGGGGRGGRASCIMSLNTFFICHISGTCAAF
jgi:hypothetical protein